MHFYTHKALLSSCMDEPHDVRGVVLLCQTPCCKPSRPQAKARMNDVAPSASVMIKCIYKKKKHRSLQWGVHLLPACHCQPAGNCPRKATMKGAAASNARASSDATTNLQNSYF